MKPDGSANENLMEPAEVEPSEFFVGLGMLIVESRLPAQSVKGRQDGPHCPPAVGDRSFHTCDAREPLCKKASEMQRQIQVLWRNHIPMCIEVLLFPDCAHGLQKATSTDAVAPPVIGDGCILLEQWTIQMTAKKSTEGCISSKALLQAMRSYLHFSQLSAWLNLSHGTEPRHIGYRISPPAEFCTSTFSNTPENHLFPLASVNKLTNIKVTLSHLPRLPEIPKPLCHEVTGKQLCSVVDYLVTRLPRSSSPKPSVQVLPHGGSPKLDKPNVLHAMSAEEREILTRPLKCLCRECLGGVIKQNEVAGSQLEHSPDVVKPTRGGSLSPSLGHLEESMAPKSTPGPVARSSEGGSRPTVKDFGAVPKRLSLQLKSIPEDILAQHPRSPQQPKASQLSSGSDDGDETTAANQKQSSFKCSIPTLLPPFMNQYKDLIPEVLPNSCLFLDGDSCSPSPDLDHFLSKTLMKQSEPLTLEEMEKYLHHLYLPGSDTARPPGINGYTAAVHTGKLRPRHGLDGRHEGKVLSTALCGNISSTVKLPSEFHDENKTFDTRDFKTEQNCGQSSAETTRSGHSIDCAADSLGVLSLLPRSTERSCSAVPSCNERTFDYRPMFTVGDVAEGDEKTGNSETALAALSPVILAESRGSPGVVQEGGLTPNPGVPSPRTLHKSTSCPSKPAFRSNGGGRVNSLLKTVMNKELMAHDESVAATNEVSIPSPRVPTSQERIYFGRCVQKSASMVFHATTGLPLQSSPVPTKKLSSGSFDYDSSLNCVRAIKNSLSCFDLDAQTDDDTHLEKVRQSYSTSAPASTNCLLGNFEESLINGRIEPAGVVNGFTVDIGASGSFCPPHLTLPVTAFFFSLSDDHAPSPYLGHINLESYSKRGYHVPKQGTIQVTLFNPNKTVVKMFVVKYDMSDMPPSHQTVLRQRTLYLPVKGSPSDVPGFMVYLRYLIHLRFASSKSSKIYLHTDIRVIFARDKFELDSRVANYELRSFTEGPENPKFSPRK